MTAGPAHRSSAWKWYVCVLLGLATTINYLDRQTLSAVAPRVMEELQLTNAQYGRLETGFGLAFAVGTSLFGFIADRTSIRWLYPAVLVLWSLMGFCTGLVETYAGMLLCRTLLGLFEAGHWPCALKTTQWLLSPKDRTLGNSILQGGTSIGAVATPLIMLLVLTPERGSWGFAFQVIGLVGIVWVFFWFASIKPNDLRPSQDSRGEPAQLDAAGGEHAADDPGIWALICSRRFAVLLTITFCVNICWHMVRVWLQPYLQKSLEFKEEDALLLQSAYYVATEAGCLIAGAATLWLARRGRSTHHARSRVFLGCSLLTSLCLLLPLLPPGGKIVVLMVVGFGSLGQFPCYYSFTQELSVRHQGMITGLLGSFAWITSSIIHSAFGVFIDATKSYEPGFMLAGMAPLASFVVLKLYWGRATDDRHEGAAFDQGQCHALDGPDAAATERMLPLPLGEGRGEGAPREDS